MILPIVAYGDPVLRKKASAMNKNYPDLEELINNMYETMYKADGVGLAAPQIGISIALFVVDGETLEQKREVKEDLKDFKQVFINPKIEAEWGAEWSFKEGCLSIPTIMEEIKRKSEMRVRYFDRNFVERLEEFKGLRARIIQHEFDHLQGVLFTDYCTAIKKQLLKAKLAKITRGDIETEYLMKFYAKKKGTGFAL